MIVASHPTGNAFVRALLGGLVERGALDSFHTTVDFKALVSLLPGNLTSNLGRRTFAVPSDRIHLRPWRELGRLLAPKLQLNALTAHERGWASLDAVCRDLDKSVAQYLDNRHGGQVHGVYAYEDCAEQTFEAAKATELKCFYDLPIAYWRTAHQLLDEESARYPEWEPTLVATRDSDEKLARKDRELLLADVVVCPSKFVLDSLPENVRRSKTCIVAEFGSPDSDENHAPPSKKSGDQLRVLFAGSLTQRKGLADLFCAMKLVNRADVELIVMGSPVVAMSFYRKQFASFTYERPRPQHEVLQLMRTCDVFVLPSIVEGRALVQQEAMSCGLPLIATPNAGGADLIDEGRTGFLVPIRDPERLAEKISWFADHREDARDMGALSRQKALTVTWDNYRAKVLSAILGNGTP